MAKLNKNMFNYIAEDLQNNIIDEAEAVRGYQMMLNRIDGLESCKDCFEKYDSETEKMIPTTTAPADKKMLKMMREKIQEIISDELQHAKILATLYEACTGLKAKEGK